MKSPFKHPMVPMISKSLLVRDVPLARGNDAFLWVGRVRCVCNAMGATGWVMPNVWSIDLYIYIYIYISWWF